MPDLIQKRGWSKYFVDSKNSIVSDRLLLFVGKIYLDDPYDKICVSSSSQSLNLV